MNSQSETSEFVIEPPNFAVIPVVGSSKMFPVHRVYCVARNYADHAIEMGHDPNKEPPFFFQKNPENMDSTGRLQYPAGTNDLHHEIELFVALKSGGSHIPVGQALDCVYGYGVGLDLTKRDVQAEAKRLGRPWDVSKAFEHSAPCSSIVPVEKTGHPTSGAIWLDVNSERKQRGDLNQMIWKVPEIISHLSGLFVLAAGDIIMTGTPAGVGAIMRGDLLKGYVEGVGGIEVVVE